MNATPGHPVLRTRIAHALADFLDSNSASHVAGLLGVATSTIIRRGNDLSIWPFADLLQLAAGCQALAIAITSYLQGDVRSGDGIRLQGDLIAEISADASVNSRIAEALTDGRVTKQEAILVRDAISKRRLHEDEQLLPDLSDLIGDDA